MNKYKVLVNMLLRFNPLFFILQYQNCLYLFKTILSIFFVKLWEVAKLPHEKLKEKLRILSLLFSLALKN